MLKLGTHRYSISPTGKHALLTSSNSETPPITKLVTLPEHKVVKVLEDNSELKKQFNSLKNVLLSSSMWMGDGNLLHAKCIKLPDFNPKNKYPLLVYVYGEPVGQVVRDSWGGSKISSIPCQFSRDM